MKKKSIPKFESKTMIRIAHKPTLTIFSIKVSMPLSKLALSKNFSIKRIRTLIAMYPTINVMDIVISLGT